MYASLGMQREHIDFQSMHQQYHHTFLSLQSNHSCHQLSAALSSNQQHLLRTGGVGSHDSGHPRLCARWCVPPGVVAKWSWYIMIRLSIFSIMAILHQNASNLFFPATRGLTFEAKGFKESAVVFFQFWCLFEAHPTVRHLFDSVAVSLSLRALWERVGSGGQAVGSRRTRIQAKQIQAVEKILERSSVTLVTLATGNIEHLATWLLRIA